MASITQRKNGRWQAKIRQTGHRTISKTFDSKGNARVWAREIERDMERGASLVTSTLAEKTTFRALLKRYRAEVTPTKKSPRNELLKLDMFGRSGLADLYVTNITPQTIASWRDARLLEVSAATVNRELNIVSHVFTMAIKEWGISANWGNPVAMIRRPKITGISLHGRNRRLEGDEEDRLLAAAESAEAKALVLANERGSTPPLPLPDLIRLALATAMRRGEISAIRIDAVDISRKTLHIQETKNDEPRTVPLSSTAISIIERQPEREDGNLWPPMQPESITRAFGKARKHAKITDLRFHDLRHEATSRFFEMGLDIMEVASITGHRDLRMLKRYTHHKAERLAEKLG